MEDRLMSCPFCGGKARINTWRDEKERKNPAKIKCCSCGASTALYDRIYQAKAAWNRRINNGTD